MATTPRIAGEEALDEAVAILRGGGLVAVPTETVYGLAARADSDEAVAAIYRAKGRPSFNPLIVHVPDFEAAKELAETDERAEALAEKLWPGPLTLVLPRRAAAALAPAVSAGLSTIARRCRWRWRCASSVRARGGSSILISFRCWYRRWWPARRWS